MKNPHTPLKNLRKVMKRRTEMKNLIPKMQRKKPRKLRNSAPKKKLYKTLMEKNYQRWKSGEKNLQVLERKT